MPKVIASFFESCGFQVLEVFPCHQGEYLGIEVRRTDDYGIKTRMSREDIAHFGEHLATVGRTMESTITVWQRKLKHWQADGKKTAAWGAGARAIGFLNALAVTSEISCVADINPRRRGKFLPGTGHEVVAPEVLVAQVPDIVIITNPTYENEIKAQAAGLGLRTEFHVL
jgi:hypothetical protein